MDTPAHRSFLDAIEACAALHFGAPAAHFVQVYRAAYGDARLAQPWLTEPIFRESFFRSVGRWFGGEASGRQERALAQELATRARTALVSHL